ncbi:interferon-stimulated 20 kDa exonuclease-like 2 [Etheostoma cragini]|uniref:interferon-stimulated 20 kDa exonuclease-like 2 n=1 Tax=Etheostoma cragini TaxID=417921 RepID=UPI00155E4538|nr:interferon-stimulated 20 kDa exonuclease-like 2 [Etheostoma cragini]XP_034729568.1 interferon-stimulated 20 kDa exonuclease-like 2 [Etheostoma cragini]XP_034729569.1 interferon-stimulated 20 kDa exonuclease-like 2 [Etheostoma cragini]
MSDIMINVSDEPAQSGGPQTGNPRRNNSWFRKKMQRGFPQGRNKFNHRTGQSRHEPPPRRQNGACAKPPSTFTQGEGSACPGSTAGGASHPSARPSTSAHSRPSSTVPVNSTGGHEKPKEPGNSNPTASAPRPSGSGVHKPSAAAAAAAAQTSTGIPTKFLAIDCEMVGTGPKGSISQLARCSLVSYDGDVVYDKFINPSMPVTDYRTRWSGIRRSDLVHATPYAEARKEILRLLMGKVVIGHAVHNDFKVLGYSHPGALTRDTSRIPLLNEKAGFGVQECASLKRLTKAIFNRDIQTGRKGHSSVEDARATMELYKVVEEEWERKLASKPNQANQCHV